MAIDIIILILAVLAFVRGWKKGMLWAVCSLVAVILGIIIAMKLSSELANYLFTQNLITNQYTLLISFVLLFIATIFVFRLGVKFVEKILDTLFLGWVNNLTGGILYAFFAVFIVSTFIWLADQVQLLKPELKAQSKTFEYVKPISPKTIAVITEYLPYCKNLIAQAQQHLEKVSQ